MNPPTTSSHGFDQRTATRNGAPLVLHVRTVSGAGGGPDKTILRSPRAIDPHRYRMAVACVYPAGDPGFDTIRRRAAALDCPLIELPERGPADPRTPWRLLRLCRRLGVAVWHGHDYKSDLLGVALRRLHPMRVVTTAHGFIRKDARTRLYTRLGDAALRRCDHAIAVSPAIARHCRDLGLPPGRVSLIPNAIDLDECRRQHDRDDARAALGIRPDAIAIGVVGRLSTEKGVDRAIRTLAALRPRRSMLELHVVGDGPQREALERLAGQLGVAGAARFWGWREDARAIVEALDALLVPSHTEGLPNAALEAMALGVPVAATAVGALPELLDHGRCGVLLEPGDVTAWVDPLTALLSDDARRDELGAAARRRVERHYAFSRRMAAVADVYDHVLHATGIRPSAASADEAATAIADNLCAQPFIARQASRDAAA